MEPKDLVFPKNTGDEIKGEWHEVLETIDEHYWAIWSVCESDETKDVLSKAIGKVLVDLRESYVWKARKEALVKACDAAGKKFTAKRKGHKAARNKAK